ncbi:hypothetical protein LTR98_011513 [Exophiala xenobiotica]|nr:hypothetical protein LTR98_011513 [Exophiala xenobiotica]
MVHVLGDLYREQGKLAEAEKMYQRALAGKEKALRADHTSTRATVHTLGDLYREQGKLEELDELEEAAEKMYQRALGRGKLEETEFQASLGTSRPLTITIRKNLNEM